MSIPLKSARHSWDSALRVWTRLKLPCAIITVCRNEIDGTPRPSCRQLTRPFRATLMEAWTEIGLLGRRVRRRSGGGAKQLAELEGPLREVREMHTTAEG